MLFALITFWSCLSSCENPHAEYERQEKFFKDHIVGHKFEYENHRYIMLYVDGASSKDNLSGWVHDPECPKCKL